MTFGEILVGFVLSPFLAVTALLLGAVALWFVRFAFAFWVNIFCLVLGFDVPPFFRMPEILIPGRRGFDE